MTFKHNLFSFQRPSVLIRQWGLGWRIAAQTNARQYGMKPDQAPGAYAVLVGFNRQKE